jgi:trehalose 6-phosphate phosphatase
VSDRTPPDALSRLDELARWLDESEGVVLGVDFDGTLSSIVEDPTDASLTPAARTTLEELASAPSIALAVVSGRAIDDLMERVDVENVVYAGNHGLELVHDGRKTVHPEAARRQPTICRLCEELDARLEDIPGCAVENKGISGTVHFRRAPDDAVSDVVGTVEEMVSSVDGIRVTAGKQVRELRPAVDWDKGRAMELLADSASDTWRTMYVGDDTTDEDAFQAIQPEGVGVHVAADDERNVETAARYRIDGFDAVPRLLAWVGMSLESRSLLDAQPDPWMRFLHLDDDRSDGGPEHRSGTFPPADTREDSPDDCCVTRSETEK